MVVEEERCLPSGLSGSTDAGTAKRQADSRRWGGFVANYLTACLLLYVCRASGGSQRVVSIDVEPIVWVDVEVVWSNRAGFKNGKARDASAH
jgi:hypothetical protein